MDLPDSMDLQMGTWSPHKKMKRSTQIESLSCIEIANETFQDSEGNWTQSHGTLAWQCEGYERNL